VKPLAIAVLAVLAAPAWAKGDKKPPADEDASADDASDDSDDADAGEKKKPAKGKPAADEPDDSARQDKDFQKQDLSGHDLGTGKKDNEFERDRFFVDKVDTTKTQKTTLVQGSLASSSFYYGERGGAYANITSTDPAAKDDSGKFSRMFTELRLQTDFRHISGGHWDARIDARIRAVTDPPDTTYLVANNPMAVVTPTHIQSGLNGQNEYDIRELWVVRNGERSDVFIGRQYVPDLGAIKIDGLRVDYASSSKFTLLGFGGLYPERGSRSLSTDYPTLRTNQLDPAGKLIGALGGGAAYRTLDAYGAIGAVALVPFQAETPRVYVTSNGYWRYGSQLDLYHYAIVDLVNNNFGTGTVLTNLSVGLNYKPSPRLRMTAAFNRVDTETLNVQANAFLSPTDANLGAVQNETFIQRLSTNLARVGASAGLGQLQRFELSAAATYRYRPNVTLTSGDGMTKYQLGAGTGVDLYASFTDRHSIKDLRLGVDLSRTFGLSAVAFQRSEVLAIRFSGAHDIANGKGEWEAEVSYATTKDKSAGITCADLTTCYGASTGSILSLGGNLYYRINHDWFGLVSLFLSRQGIVHTDGTTQTTDPTITGLTGFFRIAYRF